MFRTRLHDFFSVSKSIDDINDMYVYCKFNLDINLVEHHQLSLLLASEQANYQNTLEFDFEEFHSNLFELMVLSRVFMMKMLL